MVEKKVLTEMEDTLDALLDGAKALHLMSSGTIVPEQLNELQQQQRELVAKLQEQDGVFQSLSRKQGNVDGQARINEKLESFASLNQSFISNLAVRKGLINFEVQKLAQAHVSLDGMKRRYGGNGAPKGKPRIDEVS